MFEAEDFSAAYADFIGQQTAFSDLREITGVVEAKYDEAGYMAVRVIVPHNELTTGFLSSGLWKVLLLALISEETLAARSQLTTEF